MTGWTKCAIRPPTVLRRCGTAPSRKVGIRRSRERDSLLAAHGGGGTRVRLLVRPDRSTRWTPRPAARTGRTPRGLAPAGHRRRCAVGQPRACPVRRVRDRTGRDRPRGQRRDRRTALAEKGGRAPGRRADRVACPPRGHPALPVSSEEVSAASNERYECCTFRGGLVALNAHTGELIWKSYTIPETPRPTRMSRAGTQQHGPAGATFWSTPTVDEGRGVSMPAPASRIPT